MSICSAFTIWKHILLDRDENKIGQKQLCIMLWNQRDTVLNLVLKMHIKSSADNYFLIIQ